MLLWRSSKWISPSCLITGCQLRNLLLPALTHAGVIGQVSASGQEQWQSVWHGGKKSVRFNTARQSNSAAINSRVICGPLRSLFVLLCGSFFSVLSFSSFSFLRFLLTASWRNWHSDRPTDILTAVWVHSGFTSLMKTAFRSHKCDILNVTDREKKHHQLILKVSKSEKPKKGSFFFFCFALGSNQERWRCFLYFTFWTFKRSCLMSTLTFYLKMGCILYK